MSIAENHEIQRFGQKVGKTKLLDLAVPATKLPWGRFPV